MEQSKLKILISQREYVYRAIQLLYDLSKEMVQDRSKIPAFKSRFSRVQSIREEFVQVNENIQTLQLSINPDLAIDQSKISSFDDLYYAVIAASDALVATTTDKVIPSSESASTILSATNSKHVNARLPKLELPKFDSQTENWQSFYDTFTTLIHENNSISQVEKFHYLVSCLSGPAVSLVKGVPITTANYEVVFEALVERYQNKRILAITYLDKILHYPVIKSGGFQELQTLTNVFHESVHALKALNIQNLGDFILFHLVSRILDADTRKRFESQNCSQVPSFSELLKFLQDYVKVLETSRLSSTNLSPPTSRGTFDGKTLAAHNRPHSSGSKRSTYLNKTTPSTSFVICSCCGEAHSTYRCPTFQSLDSRSRLALVDSKKLCTNCLRTNHVIDKCISKISCLTCGLRHHTLLHTETPQASGSSVTQASTSAHIGNSRGVVLLGTCKLRVCNTVTGAQHVVRALVDSGAQDCFITTACARTLGLKLQHCNLIVGGLGQNTVFQVRGETRCVLRPIDGDDPHFKIQPIVLDNITAQMPSAQLPSVVREHCKHLTLADSDFDLPANIDILIGAEYFHDIYDGQRIKLGPGLPTALHSVFGWILTGAIESDAGVPPPNTSSLLAATRTLDEQVKRFWEVEEPPHAPIPVPEDEICERMYTDLTYREPDGRYVVPILIKDRDCALGDSYPSALSRLLNIEKKLSRHSQLKSDYIDFMREYENLNHMELTPASPTNKSYLIPHHCVLRPQSTTTKLRVVFDASCKTTNGLSLNDLVFTGPKLQTDIIDIITGFRLHVVVFTCDISKMFRNFLIRPTDRCFQHVLWRESASLPLKEYELRTITYGVSSSPYLSIRTLHQLATDHGAEYPRAAEALRHECFVDDVTTGAPSVEEALELKKQLIQLLKCAQLELRKWSSNSEAFLKTLPVDHCQTPKSFSEETDKSTLKILGVQWDPAGDIFTYSLSDVPEIEYTKRSILSHVARIFDPLGWLTPFILKAKLLLQDLWRQNISWDELVPSNISQDWRDFILDLKNLKLIEIPRQVVPSAAHEIQLIGFCDGSTKAYGCCVYLRVVTNKRVQVSLLIAKSKVAPLKVLTVNRLELCGAVLLSKVVTRIYSLLSTKLNIAQSYLFTDSSTVLSWLGTEPHKLKTFVAHRVVQVTESTSSFVWQHVSTHDNPADLCSRGLSCAQLAACNRWWSGPPWLTSDISNWQVHAVDDKDSVPELKTSHSCLIETQGADALHTLIERTSSFSRLQRTTAWLYRFINNAKVDSSKRNLSSYLSSSELDQSLQVLVKHVQKRDFYDVSSQLKSNKTISRHLQKLSIFLDSAGVLRVGGRLKQSDLPYSVKHPYLLSKQSRLSDLLIDHYHVSYLHSGPRLLHSLIQRRFWILGIRNLIRSRLSRCVTCCKAKPTPFQPVMGDLPPSRLTPGYCFQSIGIDFGGPFTVKESRRRNARTYKSYLCLIVCHAVKAVHLELVTELTTEAFIASLDRFVARRGLCQSITTDGGTNFVGAKRYLSEVSEMLDRENLTIRDQLSSRGIVWKMNPPSGAHFGGIFESGIKSTKYHLKRIVGSQVLTFEELYTVLTKVEAMLNSRPLVALSSDPNEVDTLTAGHFLIGRPLVSLPEPTINDDASLRSRWRLLQRLSQSFWRTWSRDYLHTLQQRNKWLKTVNSQPKLNDLVTIIEPNLPANTWKTGRVVKLHKGIDNHIRVVTVKTNKGELIRPANKVCLVPTSPDL